MCSARSASAEVDAPKLAEFARGALDGLDNGRKGVAEDHRTPGTEVVDIAIAIGIEEVGALGAINEWRRAAHRAECPYG